MAVTREMVLVRFEDVEAWKEARALARAIYARTEGAPMMRDPMLVASLREAANSAMGAVAEAFRETDLRHAIRRLRQASDSIREIRSLLYLALDSDTVAKDAYDELTELAIVAGRSVTALEASARGRARGEIDLDP